MREHVPTVQRADRSLMRTLGSSTTGSPRAAVIRVLIASRSEIVRAGVRTLLKKERDMEVVGEVGSVEFLLDESQRTRPDVVLLESWPLGGLKPDLCNRLMAVLPSVRMIGVLTDEDGNETFRRAVQMGVSGYLRRGMCRKELARAIRTVATGGVYFGSTGDNATGCSRRLQEPASGISPSGLAILSPQERRIIALMAGGDTNREIAVKLLLSEKTVKNYVASMFIKLEIVRRTQAVVLYLRAQRNGLCPWCQP